jgi:hypothetical protein
VEPTVTSKVTRRDRDEARIGWHMTRTHKDGSPRAGRGDHHNHEHMTITISVTIGITPPVNIRLV